MQKKLRFLLLALVFVLLLGGAYAGYRKLGSKLLPDSSAPAEMSEQFMDCTFYNAAGEPVALSSLLGKPTLVNFWATWCPFCLEEFPELQKVFEDYGDRVNFVMVNDTDGVRETVETASSFLAETGYTFPVYFDRDSSAVSTYAVYNFPTTLFLAPDGALKFRYAGAMTYEMVAAQLDALLVQK